MSTKKRSLEQHFANDGRPKESWRWTVAGLGAVILTLAILEQVESKLRARHGGDEDFRLSDYFDLIAGTSTGAIIAAALAMGWKVSDLKAKYLELGNKVFEKSLLRNGFIRAKYDEERLKTELRNFYGADTILGSPKILTGLVVVTKRHDTGSWWPIGNNPRGKYFVARKTATTHTNANAEYPLWQVIRASTAAPTFFDSETIEILRTEDAVTKGEFVDGGVSPFNNPALMAVMYATLEGYRINWPTGAEKLLVVSVGTGRADKAVQRSNVAAVLGLKSLQALMDDCAAMQELLLQWMSTSRTARTIDREVGDLQHDLVAPTPLISYLRYNADLNVRVVRELLPNVDEKEASLLTEMDAPENMQTLYDIGKVIGDRDVLSNDFPTKFDV